MDDEWSLLSNSITMLGEADLLAFDEDLQNDVCWDNMSDDAADQGRLSKFSSPALSILRGTPSPASTEPAQSPPRKRRPENPSTPPAIRRKGPGGKAVRADSSRAPKAARGGRPQSSPSAQLSPSRFLRSDADEAGPPPALVELADPRRALTTPSSRALMMPRARSPGVLVTRPAGSVVRRISFSTPSPKSEEMRRSMQSSRAATPSLMRSASPFVTIKPPPASLESLRVINRMVNKRVQESRPRGRGSSVASKAAALARQQAERQPSCPAPPKPVPAIQPKPVRPTPTTRRGKVLQRFGRLGCTLLPWCNGNTGLLSTARPRPFRASGRHPLLKFTVKAEAKGTRAVRTEATAVIDEADFIKAELVDSLVC